MSVQQVSDQLEGINLISKFADMHKPESIGFAGSELDALLRQAGMVIRSHDILDGYEYPEPNFWQWMRGITPKRRPIIRSVLAVIAPDGQMMIHPRELYIMWHIMIVKSRDYVTYMPYVPHTSLYSEQFGINRSIEQQLLTAAGVETQWVQIPSHLLK